MYEEDPVRLADREKDCIGEKGEAESQGTPLIWEGTATEWKTFIRPCSRVESFSWSLAQTPGRERAVRDSAARPRRRQSLKLCNTNGREVLDVFV